MRAEVGQPYVPLYRITYCMTWYTHIVEHTHTHGAKHSRYAYHLLNVGSDQAIKPAPGVAELLFLLVVEFA